MAVIIHPYKGYLNTLFHLHVTGDDAVDYKVVPKSNTYDDPVLNGSVSPNEPCCIQIPFPGDFIVKFSDGTDIPVTVEDGYKYGGSSFKRAFIFDECPWAFVVMHDRTYFYNRDTKESYMELISPDNIEALNKDYVLLKNDAQIEQSIYSLQEQKPFLIVSDVLYFNERTIVWKESENDSTVINLYSFVRRERKTLQVDYFAIDEANERVLFSLNNKISKITIDDFTQEIIRATVGGDVVNIQAPNLAISYKSDRRGNDLYVYNLDTNSLVGGKAIPLKGALLAQVNETNLIDIAERKTIISTLELPTETFPEGAITADYFKFNFYPCDWDVFYSLEHIRLAKSNSGGVTQEKTCSLHSSLTTLNQTIKATFHSCLICGNTICLYNNGESFVRNKVYSAAGYRESGHIYVINNQAYLYDEDTLYKLSYNGYWDYPRKIDLSFYYFQQYGVLEDRKTGSFQSADGLDLGKAVLPNNQYIKTDKYYLLPNGRKLALSGRMLPSALSNSLKIGLKKENHRIFLCSFDGDNYTEERILTDIFDSSQYRDVLLSEDGKSVMYRNEGKTVVLNVEDSTSTTYDNLSYVKHVNGIRPLFSTPSSLQPRLINPVTGLTIDSEHLSQFQFTSPDGAYFADTERDKYIEYYFRADESTISKEEYVELLRKYTYDTGTASSPDERTKVIELRRKFVMDNFEFFNSEYPEIFKNDRTGEQWDKKALKELIPHAFAFLNLFIGKRGIAVIRKSDDNSMLAKINLGDPIEYINYVSFSYDKKYIAIAGCYPMGLSKGGLFLIYDLERGKVVFEKTDSKAVWLTAFNLQGKVAAYSSEPNTFEVSLIDDSKIEPNMLHGRNFLTFSPDGTLCALSNQGYISMRDGSGEERLNWGHQPSSKVFIAKSSDMGTDLATFSDLSYGIEDCSDKRWNCPKSVASVSFSNDNKRLMMVGKDGVVIIRNLHI